MAITKTSKSFISDFITPTKFQYVAVSEILYAFISDIITTTKVECMAMQPISTSKFSVQDIFTVCIIQKNQNYRMKVMELKV